MAREKKERHRDQIEERGDSADVLDSRLLNFYATVVSAMGCWTARRHATACHSS